MTPPFHRFRTWLPGLLTALAGVACVRLFAPSAPPVGSAVLAVTGYLLVPVGLALLARRVHRDAAGRPDRS